MGDISTLVQDPQFQALDASTKRAALARVDPTFGTLSDQDFQSFLTRAGGSPPSATGAASGPEQFNPWRTSEPNEDFWTSIAHFPVHGLEHAIRGVQQMSAFDPHERLRGLHNVITGGSAAAAPFILPEALIGAPAATLMGLGTGSVAAPIASTTASAFGASPEISDLVGDAAAAGAGGTAARFGPLAGRGAIEGIRAELPQIHRWGKAGRYIGAGLGALTDGGDINSLIHGGEGYGLGYLGGAGLRAVPAAIRGIRGAFGPESWSIPGMEAEPYQSPKLNLPFTRGPETPEIGVRGRNTGTGKRLQPELIEPVESMAPSPVLSAAAKARMKFTPGNETPELGVSGRVAPAQWSAPTESLVPELDTSSLPVPGPRLKPNPAIKRRMSFTPGDEIPEIGVRGRNRIRGIAEATPPAATSVQLFGPKGDLVNSEFTEPGASIKLSPVLADQEAAALAKLKEQRIAKNAGAVNYFARLKMSPEQVNALTESEYNKHIRAAGYTPSTGKGLSRPHAEAKSAVVEALRKVYER